MAITNGDLAGRMDHIEETLERLAAGLAALDMKVDAQGRAIEETRKTAADTKEIVEAWRSVKWIGRALKWGGPIVIIIIGASAAAIDFWRKIRP